MAIALARMSAMMTLAGTIRIISRLIQSIIPILIVQRTQELKQNAYYVPVFIWTRLGLLAKPTVGCVAIVCISLIKNRLFDEIFELMV